MEDKNLTSEEGRVILTKAQERALSSDAKALVEAGFYTADLELVSRKHFIKYFLLPKFEKEYAAMAKAELEADDKAQEANVKASK